MDENLQNQNSKLFLGNNIEVMDKLIQEGVKVDLVVTSPPYDDILTYQNTLTWNFDIFKQVADRLYTILNDGCVLVWVVADQTKDGGRTLTSFKQALYFQEIGFKMHDVMIFEKNSPSFPPKRDSKRYGNIYEFMFIFVKGKKIRHDITLLADKANIYAGLGSWGKSNHNDKDGNLIEGKKITNIPEYSLRNNIWRYSVGCNKDKRFGKHPAVFPEKLAEEHLLSWSVEGDTVLDPFMGSGTTGKVAMLNNRGFIGIEINENYYEQAKKRIEYYNRQNTPVYLLYKNI